MRSHRRTLLALPFVAVVLGALGCKPEPSEPREPVHSILLVTVDTLRADVLSSYGGEARTPTIDALAADGVLFERATSQANTTGPSFASMMTSLYPGSSGVQRNAQVLPESRVTLAEAFGAHGFSTAAFVSCSILSRRYGFDQGFARFDDDLDTPYAPDAVERDGADTVDALIAWLETNAEDRTFAWLHLFDPHAPYQSRPEGSLDDRYGALPFLQQLGRRRSRSLLDEALPTIQRLYRSEVGYVDQQIGRVLYALERLGVRERTLVVLAADHGEDLFDHGFHHGHVFGLYQSITHVPLVLSHPGKLPGGMRVPDRVENIDIAPTLLSLAGVAQPDGLQGRDLVDVMLGGAAEDGRKVWSQREPADFLGGGHAVSVIDGDWKLISFTEATPRLYDLEVDSQERRSIATAHPEVLADLEAAVARWRSGTGSGPETDFEIEVESQRMLRELGYTD